MNRTISLEGPVEKIDGKLVLLIPLAAGGEELLDYAKGIGVVEGENLKINIPDWLATKLTIEEGNLGSVNNLNGKFNIVKSKPANTD